MKLIVIDNKFQELCNDIGEYLSLFQVMHSQNKIVCFLSHNGKIELVEQVHYSRDGQYDNKYEGFTSIYAMMEEIKDKTMVLQSNGDGKEMTTISLSQILSHVALHINKIHQMAYPPTLSTTNPFSCSLSHPLVLIVSLMGGMQEEGGSHHTSLLNSLFFFQKHSIPIDSLLLSPHPSSNSFLQQTAHLTGGVHLSSSSSSPKHLLFSLFLPSTLARSSLSLTSPLLPSTSLEAATIDPSSPQSTTMSSIGHMCTVCLSLLSFNSSTCPICQTTFENGTKNKWPQLFKTSLIAFSLYIIWFCDSIKAPNHC